MFLVIFVIIIIQIILIATILFDVQKKGISCPNYGGWVSL